MKTLEIKPTWNGILPLLLHAFENGTHKARQNALVELFRMAEIADRAAAKKRRKK